MSKKKWNSFPELVDLVAKLLIQLESKGFSISLQSTDTGGQLVWNKKAKK